MRRIAIVGNSGTGKTTLAARLASELGLTHIELDALYHRANWQEATPEDFQRDLRAAMQAADAATDGWTTCGNYRSAGGRINQDAADTIIWLDMPRWLILRRVTMRTVRRAITREELWNGNREPLTNFYRLDPQKNIIRWAWTKYDDYRQQNLAAMTDGTWSHATVHQLRSSAEVEAFVAEVAQGSPGS